VAENGKAGPRLALVVRPIGYLVPDGGVVQRVRVLDVTIAVTPFLLLQVQSPQMRPKGLPKKSRPVRLQFLRRAVRQPEQVAIENDLDGFHAVENTPH